MAPASSLLKVRGMGVIDTPLFLTNRTHVQLLHDFDVLHNVPFHVVPVPCTDRINHLQLVAVLRVRGSSKANRNCSLQLLLLKCAACCLDQKEIGGRNVVYRLLLFTLQTHINKKRLHLVHNVVIAVVLELLHQADQVIPSRFVVRSEVDLVEGELNLVRQCHVVPDAMTGDEEAMGPRTVVEDVNVDIFCTSLHVTTPTSSVLHLPIPLVKGLDDPLSVCPRVDVLVVQRDVAVAVVLLSRIVPGELYQEVTMHPTPHNRSRSTPCLVAFFVVTPNLVQELEFLVPIHSILQNALLTNHPSINRPYSDYHAVI